MEEAFLPDEIIVFILTFLPVKSLIRFTCVCKRFYFLFLCYPKFAQSQLKAASELKTLTHRLLFSTFNYHEEELCRLESLDLDTPNAFGDESSVRKLTLPFDLPAAVEKSARFGVTLLGSSNGIVFLAFHRRIIYMWNPSIGFFKRLPDMGLPPHYNYLVYCGVGYFPATEDYRVFIYYAEIAGNEDEMEMEMEIRERDITFVFSRRANSWKKLKVKTTSDFKSSLGTTLNEALHWVDQLGRIVAFNLGDKEGKFKEMSTPNFGNEDGVEYDINLGVSAQGCLSLAHYPPEFNFGSIDCINVWVMNEYNVPGSWTKLFNLMLSDDLKGYLCPFSALVIGTSMVAELSTEMGGMWLIRTDHEDEGKHGKYKFEGSGLNMIQIQESLIWIDD